MRRAIATVSLSGTLEEKLAAAAQVGFDGVEIFEADLLTSPLSPARIRRRCADLGLTIDLYQPFRDFEGVAPERLAANLRRAAQKFDVMADLGADTMLVCSSVAPGTAGDDEVAAAQLRELAELAATRGVRVAYEALAWGRHVNDYRHAWRIVAAAGHPALGVCLDSFHILSRGDDPAGIRDIPGDKIFFLQLADAPRLGMDVLQWSRHYRCFPGQGDFDLTGFVGHVLAAGYRGPLSLEVFNDVFRQADAERTATDALRSLIALEDEIQQPPNLDGYAFVELGVDALGGEQAERMLHGLGFARVARHRTKPVHLWRQGEARILLNRARPIGDEAAITAIGVESDDPAASARRAEDLLAPAVPRRYGPGEADLTAVAAPDGTQVFFCGSDDADWLADFEPLTDLRSELRSDRGITRVDQVSLSQPLHYFDEAVLFYRSVLGLRRHDPEDIPDPRGLVRARAMTSAGSRVRMLLHVPALGGSRLPETAHFQHVAFACGDVFAAAEAMRDAGVPILAIPDNYYADLAARVDLDPERIEVMRSHGILYDRTDDGELYHFYTAMLGRRVFFELVQRVKDYDGYGTPNTPVRMAAQYRVSRGIPGGSTAGSGP